MRVVILTDDPDVKQAILNTDANATLVDRPTGTVLKADLSTKAAVALTVKSLSALPLLAKKLYEALSQLVAKPKAELEIVSAQDRVIVKLENLSEQAMLEIMQRVFAFSDLQAQRSKVITRADNPRPAKAAPAEGRRRP